MNNKELNDYELLSQINENEEALEILFNKYKPLIYNIAYKLYDGNENLGIDIHDLYQEGMVGFFMALNNYKDTKNTLFFTYAKTCVERKMFSFIVRCKRQKHRVLNNSISVDSEESHKYNLKKSIIDLNSNPENILLENEQTMAIFEYLDQELTPFETRIFSLKKSGFTYKEIAEILDIDPKKVDNALQRIKQKLKQCIEKLKNT